MECFIAARSKADKEEAAIKWSLLFLVLCHPLWKRCSLYACVFMCTVSGSRGLMHCWLVCLFSWYKMTCWISKINKPSVRVSCSLDTFSNYRIHGVVYMSSSIRRKFEWSFILMCCRICFWATRVLAKIKCPKYFSRTHNKLMAASIKQH